jgi:hypothetical protein
MDLNIEFMHDFRENRCLDNNAEGRHGSIIAKGGPANESKKVLQAM